MSNHDQLWLPSSSREEFSPPSTHELMAMWTTMQVAGPNSKLDFGTVEAVDPGHHDSFLHLNETVLNACQVPKKAPTAIVSMDMCEMLRRTGESLGLVFNPYGVNLPTHPSCNRPSYDSLLEEKGLEDIRWWVDTLVQELADSNSIPPVDFIDDIAIIFRDLRSMGVYIVANTSIVGGAEKGTLRFIHKYMNGCFDGILFPRNYMADENQMTKARAIASVQQAIETQTNFSANVPIYAVDDTPKHLEQMHEKLGAVCFIPPYPWNSNPGPNIHRDDYGSNGSPFKRGPLLTAQALHRHLLENTL
jgi:hypothetical protein